MEKGLSVYLTVLFQDDPPDTPPWGGGGAAFSHGFPPPPLQLGPGHPWGADDEEEEDEEEDGGDEAGDQEREGSGDVDIEQGGGSAPPAAGDGVSDGDGRGGGAAAASASAVGDVHEPKAPREADNEATAGAVAAVKRDPHGLRRRRRRARTREGKAPVVSHVGDASAIARECCAGFSLTAVNKDSRKDVMWVSSMKRDRFFPGRSSWGVHCLVPTSTFQVRCA